MYSIPSSITFIISNSSSFTICFSLLLEFSVEIRSRYSGNTISKITGGKLITCQKQVADNFNTFNINVALNLVKEMQNSTKHFGDYLPNASTNSLFLTPITQAEVEDQISSQNESKAPGSYGLPVKIVKMSKTLISAQLSNIFNQSFQFGVFPEKLKFAYVTPFQKGNSKHNMANYPAYQFYQPSIKS